MTTSREMLLIGGVVSALRARKSWTGETHVQKTCFVAKVKRGVPFESDFVLYKHGPYSFDLNMSIGHMLSRGLLVTQSNPGYGPSFGVNEALWRALDCGLSGIFSQFKETIDDVAASMARKNVSELEKTATAVFVNAEYSQSSKDERASIITKIKPHISYTDAFASIEEAERI